MSWSKKVEESQFDPKNPNPWFALYLDSGLPLPNETKAAILNNQSSSSRRFLLPILRPISYLLTMFFQIIRIVTPSQFRASKALHRMIYLGLKYFVRADASYLILRHFHIGTAILKFIADNTDVHIQSTTPLSPTHLEDLLNDTFLTHDLNIFNFITELNTTLKNERRSIVKKELQHIDFSAIQDIDFNIQLPQNSFFNKIDLQSAIEIYTPFFALLLTSNDFLRANNSLQLDETIAIYIATIIGDSLPVSLVVNKHPIIPYSALNVGLRLMLHGLDAELLYAYLQQMKAHASLH